MTRAEQSAFEDEILWLVQHGHDELTQSDLQGIVSVLVERIIIKTMAQYYPQEGKDASIRRQG